VPSSQNPPLQAFTYSQAGVIAINTVLMTIDCLNFRSLSIQCTSMGTSGVVTFEWSNDGTTWATNFAAVNGTAGAVTTMNFVGVVSTPVYARYFRLRLSTATTAGTTAFNLNASQSPSTAMTQIIGNVGVANGTNRIGLVASSCIWYDDSATVLASAATFTGASRDLAGSASGVAITGFTTQARLYVPRHIPAPDANGRAAWNAMSVNEIKELVLASKGRALVLFTSIAQMKTAYDILVRTVPYTVLMQGHGGLSNKELAARFKEEEDSVLLGTKSFFTGVDLAGDTCSLVIIDKLPFPVPTEPLVSAQTDLIEERGGNSFADFTIPEMVLPLQQGFGRLIRTKRDKGVVAILDPRLVTKGYGKRIIRSLPNSPVVSSLDDVKAFFAEIDSEDR
jgi:hypothetical protein